MAVTTTYSFRVPGGTDVAGATTAPTIAQAGVVTRIAAQVIFGADADTTATITHNFQTSTGDIAQLMPQVILNQSGAGTGPIAILVTRTNSVSITLTKGTTAGSACTCEVVISKPHTLIQ